MSNKETLQFIFALGITTLFLLIIAVFVYALTAICYKKIFKAYGYERPNYAWVPFYRLYILADLTCDGNFYIGDFTVEKKYFVWWWAISYIIAFIPFVGSITSTIIHIICLGHCHYEGIKKLDPSYDNKILSYLSSVIEIILWVLVLPKKVDK